MRALVITSMEPMREGLKIRGTYWRLRLFLQAIFEIADTVDILHLVSSEFIASNQIVGRVSAEQASYLGLPLSAHLIECQSPKPLTFANYYLSGLSSIHRQHEFHWYAGAEQVAKVQQFLDRSPDIVFVHRLTAMVPILRCDSRHHRMFFDLDDIVHRVRARAALRLPIRPGKLGLLCRVPAIALAERRGATLSRMTFVCSEIDRDRAAHLRFPRVEVVPNALQIPSEIHELPRNPTILFLGSYDYPPNVSAADRLVRHIFPRIRAAVPNARLLIAGEGSRELVNRLGECEGVEALGYVEDLAQLYRSTRIICCPITQGSGTRLKLIEAAGYARPIVATEFAAEGLAFRDGIEILFREDNDAIAAACILLTQDDQLCSALGKAARARMQGTYDAKAIQHNIVRLMSQQG